MKISSFDFVLFSLRLFLDAQASTWDTSPSRELEFATGTTRYVSSANLKMRFPGVVGCRSAAVMMNEAGPSPEPCITLAFTAATVEHSPAYLLVHRYLLQAADARDYILTCA